jgi:hypothetical protein
MQRMRAATAGVGGFSGSSLDARFAVRRVLGAAALTALALLAGWLYAQDQRSAPVAPGATHAVLTPALATALGKADSDFWVSSRHGELRATGGGIEQSFTRAGAALHVPAGSVRLSLMGVGRGGQVLPVPAASPTALRNEVSYDRGAVVERYLNGPTGIEQTYLLRRAAAGAQPLTLAIGLSGSRLIPVQRGGEIALRTRAGATALRYGQLSVVDARGRRLPSHMSLSGGQIRLSVNDRGARYPLLVDPFVQAAPKFKETTPGGGENGPGTAGGFGTAMALSEDGTIAVMGSPHEFIGGAARIFTREGSVWEETQHLYSPGGKTGGRFGEGVAISADGDTVLVGQPYNGGTPPNGVGKAWVYTRSGSEWVQEEMPLTASDEAGWGFFGDSVALSANGDVAAIGGVGDEGDEGEEGEELRGAVWIFTRSEGGWTQQGSKLTGGEEIPTKTGEEPVGGLFGNGVALSADGKTLLVGGPWDDKRGAAWVFTSSGSEWTQQGPKLTGGEEESGDAGFGGNVALSSDGDTALIGGPGDDEGAGAAWVFTRSGGEWAQQGPKLTGGEEESGEAGFGSGIALSGDGDVALVGGPEDEESWGAAWEFDRSGSEWTRLAPKLTGGEEEETSGEFTGFRGGAFGEGVAISADGSTALVGAPIDHLFNGAIWPYAWEEPGEREEEGEPEAPAPAEPEAPRGEVPSGKAPSGATNHSSVAPAGPIGGVLGTIHVDPPKGGVASLLGGVLHVQRHGTIKLSLHCSAPAAFGCHGVATLTAQHKLGRHAHKVALTLGSASFSIPEAKTTVVSLPLGRAGRSLLAAHQGQLQAQLALQPGPSAGASYAVELKRRR